MLKNCQVVINVVDGMLTVASTIPDVAWINFFIDKAKESVMSHGADNMIQETSEGALNSILNAPNGKAGRLKVHTGE